MSEELEKSLRAALRPIDPGEKFTRSVLARVAAGSPGAGSPAADSATATSSPLIPRPTFRWASATLAIAVMAGLFSAHQWQAHRTQQGLEARRQLLEALQVTGENLDMAYRMINKPERPEN